MMIAYKFLTKPIFVKNGVYNLVLENKELYRNTLISLINGEANDWFVISENYNPIDFNRIGFYINDILSFNVNDKKLLTKMNTDLVLKTNELFYEDIFEIKSGLLVLAEKLAFEFDYDYSFCDDIDTASLIKILRFKVRDDSDDILESLVLMVKLLQKYLNIKLIFCSNLFIYLSIEEIASLSKMMQLIGMPILNIENRAPLEFEKSRITIVDSDLCELVDN